MEVFNKTMGAEFDGLTKIIDETIRQTSDPNFLDLKSFREKMEQEFSALGFREDYDRGVENILIVRLTAMGDFIMTTPAIREIRRNYPFAHITLVVGSHAQDMAEFCPYVNEVIPFDDYAAEEKSVVDKLRSIADFAKKYLWKRRYRLGFALRAISSMHFLHLLLLYVSGAKERVGYISHSYKIYTGEELPPEKNPGNILLTHPVINPKEIVHVCARNLYILKDYGLQIRDTDLEVWYDSLDLRKAKKLMDGFAPDRLKIVVGITASEEMRKYPVEKYLSAFRKIIDKGAALIIFGGPSEIEDAKFLEENLPAEYVKNLCEIISNRRIEAAIIYKFADMYIGNCTGTADVAAAAKLPVICLSCEPEEFEQTLRGITYYSTFFPWQTNAIVIRPKHPLPECRELFEELTDRRFLRAGCGDEHESHCITQIEPEEIVEAYDEMIRYLKTSGIKRTIQPEIIRDIDATEKLSGLF